MGLCAVGGPGSRLQDVNRGKSYLCLTTDLHREPGKVITREPLPDCHGNPVFILVPPSTRFLSAGRAGALAPGVSKAAAGETRPTEMGVGGGGHAAGPSGPEVLGGCDPLHTDNRGSRTPLMGPPGVEYKGGMTCTFLFLHTRQGTTRR